MKFLVNHRKELAIILYIMAALFYIASVYEFFVGNTSQGTTCLLLGSAEMFIASSNIASKKSEENNKEDGRNE